MAKYRGKTVTVVRDVVANDRDFDANKAKAVVRHEDGREETVTKADVTE